MLRDGVCSPVVLCIILAREFAVSGLRMVAAGGDLGVAVDHADLFTQLVDEDADGVGPVSYTHLELCGPLFVSAHHKLSLTERGLSLQRHAAPVVEQFQQMQAALHAEIQSAQPVRIGISVSLVPDYLPGLETQLDKFRQQYPHIEMRFRLLENDAVADGVEQGELDAGLVMDLGTAAPVLARTTLRADPACLLVPRGHPFWEKERVPLSALRGQRVLLPSLCLLYTSRCV